MTVNLSAACENKFRLKPYDTGWARKLLKLAKEHDIGIPLKPRKTKEEKSKTLGAKFSLATAGRIQAMVEYERGIYKTQSDVIRDAVERFLEFQEAIYSDFLDKNSEISSKSAVLNHEFYTKFEKAEKLKYDLNICDHILEKCNIIVQGCRKGFIKTKEMKAETREYIMLSPEKYRKELLNKINRLMDGETFDQVSYTQYDNKKQSKPASSCGNY